MFFVRHPQILHKHCLQFLLGVKWPQEKLKTMLMQNLGVTNKEHYGMLWYFLEWSIRRFHVVVVNWTSKKCTKKRDARADLLF